MPPRTANVTLSGMVEDFSEDEFARDGDALLTPDSAVENRAPARKGGKSKAKQKAATSRVAKVNTRRASGASVLEPKKAAAEKKSRAPTKRSALAERDTNADETEEVDEFEDDAATKRNAKDAVPAAKATRATKRTKARVDESIVEPAEAPKKSKGRPTAAEKKAAKLAKQTALPETVPETQVDPMDVEDSGDVEQVPETQPVVRAAQRNGRHQTLQPIASSRPRPTTGAHRRAGSASDTERGDPMLRRKLGEMTKKFDNIDLKYKQLRDLSMQEKEGNFEKLKRTTDKREQDQNNIITALKGQLEEQKAIASQAKTLRTEVDGLEDDVKQLEIEKKKLTTQLNESQNEIKSLQARLAASRAQSSEPARAPANAAKQRQIYTGTADAVKEAQTRQLKEDLYSDLSGLIITGIKQNGEENVYDCIQTGRNGTLHFHLTIPSDEEQKATGQSYEDVEFAYTPFLDQARDKDLIQILPDYLLEEISFPRHHAVRFYARINDSITKKVEFAE
ncbi:hypothetical protein EJ05DRAFT_471882 [Pseudovirgaria hyperparasitica]|uniref:Monopolin complex subunit Csm1/Pcs1 C-terminal domain-containing protein n=1 Tax=Pseudovirgaria hyperparasitica TaxID=470096 RepID=A0A6A6WL68_9PEZI|nr:uncharacterized protein EJ05DRAFT_471882 [Pseudovirgaria hyperparasitica]KAF2762921.1 hypothetical protein EJ05DRAFT_471882 [Pseudovirgaria hyperparasitica]